MPQSRTNVLGQFAINGRGSHRESQNGGLPLVNPKEGRQTNEPCIDELCKNVTSAVIVGVPEWHGVFLSCDMNATTGCFDQGGPN